MADADPLVTRMVVLAAASAAGPMGDEAAWFAKVGDLIPVIGAMVRNEDNRPMMRAKEILEADVFFAEYRGYEYEESSTRLIVNLQPDNRQAEIVRTHRTDERPGRVMRERLDRLEVGQWLLVYKALEVTSKNVNRKVRVLVHFEKRRRINQNSPGSHLPGDDEPPPAPPPARPGAGSDPIANAINSLSVEQLVSLRTRCVEEGISFPVPATPNERHRMEVLIDGIKHAW